MEFIAYALVGVVWFVWIGGIVRPVRAGRHWTALSAVLLGPLGILVALYGLFASPLPGSALDRKRIAAVEQQFA